MCTEELETDSKSLFVAAGTGILEAKRPRLHVCMDFRRVADESPADERITALMRRIDELLGEAAQLREDVVGAVRTRSERPFWPDRRHMRVPHEPERRAR